MVCRVIPSFVYRISLLISLPTQVESSCVYLEKFPGTQYINALIWCLKYHVHPWRWKLLAQREQANTTKLSLRDAVGYLKRKQSMWRQNNLNNFTLFEMLVSHPSGKIFFFNFSSISKLWGLFFIFLHYWLICYTLLFRSHLGRNQPVQMCAQSPHIANRLHKRVQ